MENIFLLIPFSRKYLPFQIILRHLPENFALFTFREQSILVNKICEIKRISRFSEPDDFEFHTIIVFYVSLIAGFFHSCNYMNNWKNNQKKRDFKFNI